MILSRNRIKRSLYRHMAIMSWLRQHETIMNRLRRVMRFFERGIPASISSYKKIGIAPLFPLDCAAAEVIFAPFHDPEISTTLPVTFEPARALGCKVEHMWCWTNLSWETCPIDTHAATLYLTTDLDISAYGNLIFCFMMSPEASVSFEAEIDHTWKRLGSEAKGTGSRMEMVLPVRGNRMSQLKMVFTTHRAGFQIVHLSWFGLQKRELIKSMLDSRLRYDSTWPGLIKPISEWGDVHFEMGLLFDESDLDTIRSKSMLPGWVDHYIFLEQKAAEYLRRSPEDDLAEYLPMTDLRYIRERERGKTPYYFEALVLGFVGLVNQDKGMIIHALRYLMCMLHTRHWTQSAESRLLGSTWDQRSFFEEITTTTVTLLSDWYSFALTDRAKDLIRKSIWDKGLAIIERDMMKFDYLYHMNQGAVFCRARVLGGLFLERSWPHMGNYVKRAFSDLTKILKNYIEPDGGVHEGIGYFCQTFQGVAGAGLAYCRMRGKNPRRFLKKFFAKSQRYVAALSGSVPGTAIPYGDCRIDSFCGDVIPVMAGFFPGSVYENILSACIQSRSIFSVTGTLSNSGGILGLVYGPERIVPSKRIVPTFSILKKSGHLTSYRESNGRSTRVHIYGSSANLSHSHLDRGAFMLEMDEVPVFIDRGMIEYWYSDIILLTRSCMHNVITPLLSDGTYPDQLMASRPVIPRGRGNNQRLQASLDLTNVWRNYMNRCVRTFESVSLNQITIHDEGELKETGRVAFHLHSTIPFSIKQDKKKIGLTSGKIHLEILPEWAEDMLHRPESVNLKHEPVYHLILHSPECREFNLKTVIRRHT